MTEAAIVDDAAILAESPFLQQLVKVWRAQDSHGTGKTRATRQLISEYIVTKEQRKAMPIIADPGSGDDLAAGAVLQRGRPVDRTRLQGHGHAHAEDEPRRVSAAWC